MSRIYEPLKLHIKANDESQKLMYLRSSMYGLIHASKAVHTNILESYSQHSWGPILLE